MRRYPQSIRQRILRQCSIRGDCWVWNGLTRNGYGIISVNGSTRNAHRVAYAAFREAVPLGVSVLHTCNNPLCCYPGHLFLEIQEKPLKIIGTAHGKGSDQMADAV